MGKLNLVFNEVISSALRAVDEVSGLRRGGEPGRLTSSVDAVRTLELRTISDDSPQSDDRWLLLLFARLSDRVVDASEVATNPSIWGPQQSTTKTY